VPTRHVTDARYTKHVMNIYMTGGLGLFKRQEERQLPGVNKYHLDVWQFIKKKMFFTVKRKYTINTR
jgi:hypothetical protein